MSRVQKLENLYILNLRPYLGQALYYQGSVEPVPVKCNHAGVEIIHSKTSISCGGTLNIVVVYKPPKVNLTQHFRALNLVLMPLMKRQEKIVIVDDFNIDILVDEYYSKELIKLMDTLFKISY